MSKCEDHFEQYLHKVLTKIFNLPTENDLNYLSGSLNF